MPVLLETPFGLPPGDDSGNNVNIGVDYDHHHHDVFVRNNNHCFEEEKDPSSSSSASSMIDNIPMATPALLDISSSTCGDIEKQKKGTNHHHHHCNQHHPPLTSSSKSNILPPPPPPLLASSSWGPKCRTPTMSKTRKRQQHDPLGASLHSYRPRNHHHEEPIFHTNSSKHRHGTSSSNDGCTIVEQNTYIQQPHPSAAASTSSSRVRGGESLRQRGGALRRSYSGGIKSATIDRKNSYDDHESPDSPPPVDPQHLPSFSDDGDDDDYDSFDNDYYNYPTKKKKNKPSKQRRRREFSSKIHNHQYHLDCGMVIQNAYSSLCLHHPQYCYLFGFKLKRRWLLVLQVAVIVILVVGVSVHSRRKVHMANEQLQVSQMEKFDILNQMKWLDNRSKQNLSVSSSSKALEYQQRQIDAMEDHIRVLEQTIQDNSKQELFRKIPSLLSSRAMNVDIEGEDEDQLRSSSSSSSQDGVLNVELITTMEEKEPLIFQLWYNEMPYTTLAWINQIQEGMWLNANMQLIDASWVDIYPADVADSSNSLSAKSTQPKRLAFRETPITAAADSANQRDTPRRFVLGMRNIIHHQPQQQQKEGRAGGEEEQSIDDSNNMFVLTIHLEVGTCESDETESCFGELIGGFDQLTDMMTMVDNDDQGVTITSIQIQNHPKKRI